VTVRDRAGRGRGDRPARVKEMRRTGRGIEREWERKREWERERERTGRKEGAET